MMGIEVEQTFRLRRNKVERGGGPSACNADRLWECVKLLRKLVGVIIHGQSSTFIVS
jgi:hypothetical protein